MFKKIESISDKTAYTLFGLILGIIGGFYPSFLITNLELKIGNAILGFSYEGLEIIPFLMIALPPLTIFNWIVVTGILAFLGYRFGAWRERKK